APPIYVARRDVRGAAVPASQPPAPPFVDKTGDGLADLDAHGRFAGASGQALAIGTPFLTPEATDPPCATLDAQSRLLGQCGPLHDCLPLEGTVLSALVREQGVLANPDRDDLFGLLHGAGGLLGARVGKAREWKSPANETPEKLSYQGFDLAHAPLLA